ncbi:MAG: HPF/RaiA family ribosome-associated protein [Rickettsiales bacterium]|nr:HPF/RaiA family ribosome-associated protein [Rickettsiales bacterium]
MVRITGHDFQVGESLSSHVEKAVEAGAKRYGIRLVGANATFAPAPHGKVAASILMQAKGHEFFARAEAEDARAAFGDALAEALGQAVKEGTRIKAIERKKK